MLFVVSGNPAFLLAEWPPSSVCSFVVSGNLAFSLLLLYVIFGVTGNPTFSLGKQTSSPKGGRFLVVRCILIG